MAINLHSRYDKKIAETFRRESFIDGRIADSYSFVGVRTVKISTPTTVPLVDYQRNGTNRYGIPTEMQDTVQELTMTQDKSFSVTVDKGNNEDQQGIKAAGRMMAMQLREQVVPMKDNYSFKRLAMLGGKIVGDATALSKTNIGDRIAAGGTFLDDAEVPADGRTLFITATNYKYLRLSPEFLNLEQIGTKAIAKGQVGEVDGMAVVKVPAGRFPANVNFIIVHKSSATSPSKIDDTKLHVDPPGLSGNLLEGRFYYDLFVIGQRANGIYVDVDTGSGKGIVLAAPTINPTTGAITPAAGASVKYTMDGSDPRYSDSAVVGTAPASPAGKTIKAYAYRTDETQFPSPVATAVIA